MDSAASCTLTVNVGSSSIKLDLFSTGNGSPLRIGSRHIDGGKAEPRGALVDFISVCKVEAVNVHAVAHRIVHGGNLLTAPAICTPALDVALDELADLAPLHNPAAFHWLRCARDVFADCAHVLVPDTAFFADLPPVARAYALPAGLSERYGLRRYGFHGLAHEAMLRYWRCSGYPGEKIITIQLGAGCSMAAIAGDRAVDTSMGFTPLEGLVMATRSGDVDPGLVMYLQKAESMPPDEVEALLNGRSGLLGVSGMSADMSQLLNSDAAAAKAAVALYIYRARKYLGAYMAALGGADVILFGGGVGERAPEIRAGILSNMAWCGVTLDGDRNAAHIGESGEISDASGAVRVHVVCVDEASLLAAKAGETCGVNQPM